MKKFTFAFTLIFISFCLSCSEEEDPSLYSDVDFFPLEVGNAWTYKNQFNQNSVNIQGTEIVSVNEKIQNKYGFTQTSDESVGVFSSMLSSGKVYKQNANQRIVLEGDYSIDLESELSNLEIPLQDIVLYDVNSSQGGIMSVSSGTFQQDINGFPVDFIFEISSVHKGFLTSKVINNVSYEDVFISEIQVSLSANVFIVFNTFTVLQKQKITSITNYYAKDIGLVKSEVNTKIIFEDIPEQLGIEIPDVDFNSSQEIETYLLSPNS